jgi:hypothetical protein
LRGDLAEAKVALAVFRTLKPQLQTLADLHRYYSKYRSRPFAALWTKTIDVGLRRVGLPDE